MTDKKPNTGLVVRAARAHICPHCPFKWGPERASIDQSNPCEMRCDLFRHLPGITTVTASADPMLRSVKSATAAAIAGRVAHDERGTSPLWRNRNRLLALLSHVFGG
jgi:hypothetical protein